MRTTTVTALAVSLALVAGCTAEEPAEVLGVQLESPTPEEPAEPTDEPGGTGDDAEAPTDDATSDEGDEAPADEPADGDGADDDGTGDDAADEDATEEPADDPEADEPAEAPAPAATRSPRPDPEVLTARDAEVRTVWTTDQESGTWIETSGTSITPDDVAVLTVGLAPTDDAPDAATREATCVVTLEAPDARGVVAQGTVTVDLLVDDEVAKRYQVTLDVDQLAAGESVELPSRGAREVALAETERVSCRASFAPAG